MSLIHSLKYCTVTRTILINKYLKNVIRTYNADTASSGGYAKAFEKFKELKESPQEKPATFASLLRNSKFVDVSGIAVNIAVMYI